MKPFISLSCLVLTALMLSCGTGKKQSDETTTDATGPCAQFEGIWQEQTDMSPLAIQIKGLDDGRYIVFMSRKDYTGKRSEIYCARCKDEELILSTATGYTNLSHVAMKETEVIMYLGKEYVSVPELND